MTRRVPKTMHHTGSLKSLEAVLEAKGFKEAPRDHPIYSEGPSIVFLSNTGSGGNDRQSEATPIGSSKDNGGRKSNDPFRISAKVERN